jgi:hypothetical protein
MLPTMMGPIRTLSLAVSLETNWWGRGGSNPGLGIADAATRWTTKTSRDACKESLVNSMSLRAEQNCGKRSCLKAETIKFGGAGGIRTHDLCVSN